MQEKSVVIVDPARLQSGLWGYPEGDIARAYSADTYGSSGKVREPFRHEGILYVTMALSSGGLEHAEAMAYPVMPEMMDQPQEPSDRGYAGRKVKLRNQACVFGHPVVFRQRPLDASEIIDLTRRMFAYGGWFASRAGTYERFIMEMLERAKLAMTREVLLAELAGSKTLPQSQADMRQWIEKPTESEQKSPVVQLNLF